MKLEVEFFLEFCCFDGYKIRYGNWKTINEKRRGFLGSARLGKERTNARESQRAIRAAAVTIRGRFISVAAGCCWPMRLQAQTRPKIVACSEGGCNRDKAERGREVTKCAPRSAACGCAARERTRNRLGFGAGALPHTSPVHWRRRRVCAKEAAAVEESPTFAGGGGWRRGNFVQSSSSRTATAARDRASPREPPPHNASTALPPIPIWKNALHFPACGVCSGNARRRVMRPKTWQCGENVWSWLNLVRVGAPQGRPARERHAATDAFPIASDERSR